MKFEKLFFPLMVFAAIVTIYLLFRKSPQVTTQTQPSTAPSGIPNYATESPSNYNVQMPQLGNAPALVYLQNPMSNNPAGEQRQYPPTYLSFNFGPNHDLTKVPDSNLHEQQQAAQGKNGGCGGCSGGCNSCDQNQNTFPDGQGKTRLASSHKAQIVNAPRSFLEIATENLGMQPPDILEAQHAGSVPLKPAPAPKKNQVGFAYVPHLSGGSVYVP